jgi:predicted RNase H-related nuclease YkuK (DUF458 family)
MKIDLSEVKQYLEGCSKESKIYIGADSERLNVDGTWWVDYMTCLIVHIDSKHGGKVFASIVRERDYDQKVNRPKMRLMTEAYKAAEMYLEVAELIEDFDCEIHLDLNPLEIHGSNCALSEAMGYIRGMTGIEPIVKPSSWAASNVADAVKRLTAGKR